MTNLEKIKLFYVKTIILFRLLFIKIFRYIIFKEEDYKSFSKILINRDGAFGDSVVALPSLSIIRQNFPSAKIDLITFSDSGVTFSDLGLKDGLIDNILVRGKKNRKETLDELKENRYDLFIQLPQNLGLYKSIRNMFFVRFFLKIKSGFGWDSGRIKSFIETQKKYLQIPTETMRLLNNLKHERIIGDVAYPIKEKEPTDRSIVELLKRNIMVFIIGGKLKTKKWPLDSWIKLANLIGNDYEIIIVGGPLEVKEAEHINSRTKNSHNLCNKLSISELFFVFKRSQMAISNDTGAMHLCDAAGTNVIGLFSTRELSPKWYPNRKGAIVIENNINIANITPDNVYNTIK